MADAHDAARPIRQAKDITTEAFLAAVRADQVAGWVQESTGIVYNHATAYSVAARLDAPVKVVMAKVAKLARRGVIEGCGCGCGSPIWITVPGVATCTSGPTGDN